MKLTEGLTGKDIAQPEPRQLGKLEDRILRLPAPYATEAHSDACCVN
jgi:hypothetical protein